jgi:hypothetical protein
MCLPACNLQAGKHHAPRLEAAAQEARGPPGSQEQCRWPLQREAALDTRPCAHLGCTNMAGSSEDS